MSILSTHRRNAFISHAFADNTRCTSYAEQLRARGMDVWYDLDNAPEGRTLTSFLWQELQARATLIVFVTAAALQSFRVNLEIDAFLSLMAQDRSRMMLLVRLEPCEMPPFMNTVLWIDGVDLTVEQVVERIVHALNQHIVSAPDQVAAMSVAPGEPVPALSREQARAQRMASAIAPERFPPQLAQLGFTAQILGGQEVILPPLCKVPVGSVRLGSDRRHDPRAWETELQRRDVMLPAFQIARFPVTVSEYACAVRAGMVRAPAVDSYSPITWPIQLARPDHPVVNVSWHDAMAYVKWLTARTGQPWWRLPTEAEWEKAARFDPTSGTCERIYPWGDQFDPNRCNTSESRIGTTMPVGRHPAGESPCGAQDMAGNVWEWTVSAYADDYSQATIRSVTDALERRVRRGGSWRDTAWHARAARRSDLHPHNISEDLGFRLVYALPQLIP